MICGRRFSFITIASIDFWSDLQLIFLHFNACILPSIIRHTVVYAVWYGVWFLMVWPWFGHSSLNHNEYAVSSAVSRMKMPPVREHASSLISYGIRHGIRHIHCDSMKYDLMLHWITMNMPHPVPYPVWKCLPYGSTHPPYYVIPTLHHSIPTLVWLKICMHFLWLIG